MSSDLNEIVDLSITQDTVGAAVANFGILMMLSCNAPFSERARVYDDADGVLTDGFAATSPEYRGARAYFSQKPRPKQLIIGRAVGKPTQVYTVTVATVANLHVYTLNVKGEGVTDTTVTFTSDGTATNDEIVAGLVVQLNLVTGKNYTAAATGSAGSQVVTMTGSSAGAWFSVETVNVNDLKTKQTQAEPGTTLAADLAAIQIENDDWYGFITLYNSKAIILAAAAWAEGEFKIYVGESADSECVTLAAGNGDALDTIHASAYARTAGAYYPAPAGMFAAAWFGKMLPKKPGSATWALKTLAGVAPTNLTATHKTNLKNKKASCYKRVSQRNITWEGHTGDGDWIDTQIFLDWQYDDMQKAVFVYLAGQDKVGIDDRGRVGLAGVMEASLARGVARGGLLEDPGDAQADPPTDPTPVVFVPDPDDVSDADKAQRDYTGIQFAARVRQAVHKVGIAGNVTL